MTTSTAAAAEFAPILNLSSSLPYAKAYPLNSGVWRLAYTLNRHSSWRVNVCVPSSR